MKSSDYKSQPAKTPSANDVACDHGSIVGPDRWSGVSVAPLSAPRTVKIEGNIRLLEGWVSNNPDRVFKSQLFEIREKSKVARIGLDGRMIVTCSPKQITWYGGKAADLEHVVHVKIVSQGAIVVDDALCAGNSPPEEVPGGVKFEVLEV